MTFLVLHLNDDGREILVNLDLVQTISTVNGVTGLFVVGKEGWIDVAESLEVVKRLIERTVDGRRVVR